MRQEFESDASGLEKEINGQIENFNDFDTHEQAIADLEDRIGSAVKRRDALSDRLEQARTRVQAWETREDEWQAWTSRTYTAALTQSIMLTKYSATEDLLGLSHFIRPGSTRRLHDQTYINVGWRRYGQAQYHIICSDDSSTISNKR